MFFYFSVSTRQEASCSCNSRQSTFMPWTLGGLWPLSSHAVSVHSCTAHRSTPFSVCLNASGPVLAALLCICCLTCQVTAWTEGKCGNGLPTVNRRPPPPRGSVAAPPWTVLLDLSNPDIDMDEVMGGCVVQQPLPTFYEYPLPATLPP